MELICCIFSSEKNTDWKLFNVIVSKDRIGTPSTRKITNKNTRGSILEKYLCSCFNTCRSSGKLMLAYLQAISFTFPVKLKCRRP